MRAVLASAHSLAIRTDFGIARAVEDAADEEALTRTGISVGTVGRNIFPDGSFVAAIDTAAAAGDPLSTRLRAEHRVAAFRVILNFAEELKERLRN